MRINRVHTVRFIIYILFIFFIIIECKPSPKTKSKKPRPGRKGQDKDTIMLGLYYCIGGLAIMFLPLIGVFFHNLYKDPMTPQLISEMYGTMKSKTLSYMSAKKDEDKE
jgi:hypothetical protein